MARGQSRLVEGLCSGLIKFFIPFVEVNDIVSVAHSIVLLSYESYHVA